MLGTDDQEVRTLRAGDHRVAYTVVGAGPPVVLGGWWCAHLLLNWQDPRFRQFLAPLAARHTIIRFDAPGTGAAEEGVPPATVEEEVALLAGVADALGLARFGLIGASSGAAAAAAFAATRPERVERLVLYGSFARGDEIATAAARAALLDVVTHHWGLGSRVLADLFVPGSSADERDDFARFQRRSARPEQAARSLADSYRTDVTQYLTRIRVPTGVLHRRGDRAVPFALGADMARRIRGAALVPLSGVDHFPWRGDMTAVAEAMLRGLGHRLPDRPAPAAISHREREILALVAQGLTDAQIAERLTLSPHTVHRHVANARIKLGVRSRAAAAAAMGAAGG